LLGTALSYQDWKTLSPIGTARPKKQQNLISTEYVARRDWYLPGIPHWDQAILQHSPWLI
jgi:hypothetical protein